MGGDNGNQPSLADLMAKLEAMQADIDGLKAKSGSTSESSNNGRADGHTRDMDRPPKFQKWEFPRYDGTTDPRLFLNKCESYFQQQRTMAEERVWMASYNLNGAAQEWFIQLQEDEGTPPWGRFKDLLDLRFGRPLRSAPFFELTECKRTGTVEYSNRFQSLLFRAGRVDESQRVQLYTGGLLPPLSHTVRLHNPATLHHAMSLARQVELMELNKLAAPPPRPAPRAALPAPPQRPALSAPPVALPVPPAAPLLALPAPQAAGAPAAKD
jgi:hypothetical protein